MAHFLPIGVLLALVLLFGIATMRSTPLALVLLLGVAIAYLAVPPVNACESARKSPEPVQPRAFALAVQKAPPSPPPAAETPETTPAPSQPAAPSAPAAPSQPVAAPGEPLPPTEPVAAPSQPVAAPNNTRSSPPPSGPAPTQAVVPTAQPSGVLHNASALPEIQQSTAPENQWIPSQQQQTFQDKQREDFHLHRALRRAGEWDDKWTEEDAKKYERMRRNVEYKIAKNLRPDKYMIVDRTAKMSDTLESDYPFASVHGENAVFHTSRFRSRLPDGGSDQMVANLQSN